MPERGRHELVALLEHGHAAGHFAVLDGPLDFGPRVGQRLAHLFGDSAGEPFLVLAEQSGQAEQRLHAPRGRHVPPLPERFRGGLHGAVGLGGRRERRPGDHLARARILHVQQPGVGRLAPLARHVVPDGSRFHRKLLVLKWTSLTCGH